MTTPEEQECWDQFWVSVAQGVANAEERARRRTKIDEAARHVIERYPDTLRRLGAGEDRTARPSNDED